MYYSMAKASAALTFVSPQFIPSPKVEMVAVAYQPGRKLHPTQTPLVQPVPYSVLSSVFLALGLAH
jgi:hypothetical protein